MKTNVYCLRLSSLNKLLLGFQESDRRPEDIQAVQGARWTRALVSASLQRSYFLAYIVRCWGMLPLAGGRWCFERPREAL
jgi:hypothetical protein